MKYIKLVQLDVGPPRYHRFYLFGGSRSVRDFEFKPAIPEKSQSVWIYGRITDLGFKKTSERMTETSDKPHVTSRATESF